MAQSSFERGFARRRTAFSWRSTRIPVGVEVAKAAGILCGSSQTRTGHPHRLTTAADGKGVRDHDGGPSERRQILPRQPVRRRRRSVIVEAELVAFGIGKDGVGLELGEDASASAFRCWV